jgi:rhodanese-related sulfurtransferase
MMICKILKEGMIVTTAIFFVFGCASSAQQTGTSTLSVAEFEQKLKSTDSAQLVDVRTADEYASGHLTGSQNIDWNGEGFEKQIQQLDKTKPVFVYCRSGRRSAEAMNKMNELGFTQVYNLAGGILQWTEEGKPVEE